MSMNLNSIGHSSQETELEFGMEWQEMEFAELYFKEIQQVFWEK